MIGRKLLSGFCLIGFPAVCATFLLVKGYRTIAPWYEEQERARVLAEYREAAADLKENPTKGAGVIPARRGDWRTMKPGRWGYVEDGARAVVWYAAGKRIQSVTVPRTQTYPVGKLLLALISFSLVSLWGLTLAGCWIFRNSVKERDDFVAATAHDLTTPLVALRRLIGQDDEEAKNVAERMMRLVKNLTDFLRLGGRRPTPKKEVFDLRRLYNEAYALFREDYRWQLSGQDVAMEGPDEVWAEADETMTLQVIWNLLANDLKYAAPFGSVSVRFAEETKRVSISLVDEGPGLTARERRHIFDRYYRAKSVMKSGKGGFGIGLCTAREFARAMGGDLTVAANTPKGCVFMLTLRRAK